MNRTLTVLTGVVLAAIFSATADAAAPEFMTQQGRLLDTDGAPVNGELAFVFSIYDADTAGTVLWTETKNITLSDGFFSAQLGEVTPLDTSIFDGSSLFLGVTVGADAEMTPRQALSSTPYAFSATNADTAINVTGDITPNSVSVGGGEVINAAGTWVDNVDFGGLISVVEAVSGESAVGGRVTTTASCGAGKIATGGGCSLTAVGSQSARLKQSEPTAGAAGFICTCDAFPDESITSDLSPGPGTVLHLATSCTVRARAICVPNP